MTGRSGCLTGKEHIIWPHRRQWCLRFVIGWNDALTNVVKWKGVMKWTTYPHKGHCETSVSFCQGVIFCSAAIRRCKQGLRTWKRKTNLEYPPCLQPRLDSESHHARDRLAPCFECLIPILRASSSLASGEKLISYLYLLQSADLSTSRGGVPSASALHDQRHVEIGALRETHP